MTSPSPETSSESSRVIHRVHTFSGRDPIMTEHFPGEPIVPAFLQLRHVREIFCTLVDVRPERVRVKGIKFLAPLPPDCSVDVWLERKSSGAATFRLLRGRQTISQGELCVA